LTFFQRLVYNAKLALGVAVAGTEQAVAQEIGQIPAVQQTIQAQVDLRVRNFLMTAIPIAALFLIAIILIRGKK
jgi:hypothetical protein